MKIDHFLGPVKNSQQYSIGVVHDKTLKLNSNRVVSYRLFSPPFYFLVFRTHDILVLVFGTGRLEGL